MKLFLLIFFTAMLTLAAVAVVASRMLLRFASGASFGAVAGGVSGKLLGLIVVLSVTFIILL